ncbi:metal-dependent hydrolase [Pedosphaera parvula]|uniref:Membrane-bound metal-dependent hydrolase n=1 Tax=Pedosphaera parvula (strain Ellin514) TaxID=320771 RepID=B9XIY1_PEDPL|nr:metal-dependent hydrolase [Pedosphaera parvula]EEF60208.1 membrane-bound metal-dependent hydrolase [Pedosphaera parvula Ellin514]
MPSAFSHAFAAVALGKTYTGSKMSWRFWVLAAGSAAMPDFDVLAFGLGIPYESMFGHRGFTHSLLFALFWGLLVVWCEFKQVVRFSREWWSLFAFFFVATASHGFLDAFTDGGEGVGFFVPFNGMRYFFPWTPIEVSPIGVGSFFSQRGWIVVKSELVCVVLPFAVLWLAATLWRWAVWSRIKLKRAEALEPGSETASKS